jgi:hypothetical protein
MNELAYSTEVDDEGKEFATMQVSYKDTNAYPTDSLPPQIPVESEPPAAQRKDPFRVEELEKISDPSNLPTSVPKPKGEKNPEEVVFDKETGAVKHDGLKPRVDLIPSEVIFAMGSMFRHGATKYADRNWEKGMKWSRVFGSTMRHLWAWWGGEDIDPESKQPHLYSAACCIAMLIAYRERKVGSDDRYFNSNGNSESTGQVTVSNENPSSE